MKRLLLRWLLNALGFMAVIGVVNVVLPRSIVPAGLLSALWTVLILAALNAFIRPVLRAIALPLNCLTFGLMGVVINLLLFWLALRISGKFVVEQGTRGLAAVLAAYLGMTIVSVIVNQVVRKED